MHEICLKFWDKTREAQAVRGDTRQGRENLRPKLRPRLEAKVSGQGLRLRLEAKAFLGVKPFFTSLYTIGQVHIQP